MLRSVSATVVNPDRLCVLTNLYGEIDECDDDSDGADKLSQRTEILNRPIHRVLLQRPCYSMKLLIGLANGSEWSKVVARR